MATKYVITYEELKQAASDSTISIQALEELKSVFEADIKSKRRYHNIRSIADFIEVLEKRDVLSEKNIDFIHKLTDYCQSNSLKDALLYYCIPEYIEDLWISGNVYQKERTNDSLEENLQKNFVNHTQYRTQPVSCLSFIGILSDDQRKAIYKKLSKELGRDWRNLGRELSITEGEMDNIESQSIDLSTRIVKLLKTFEEDECNDPKQHCQLLCQALRDCGRKDLERDINKIMSQQLRRA